MTKSSEGSPSTPARPDGWKTSLPRLSFVEGLLIDSDVRKLEPSAPATEPTTGTVETLTEGTFAAMACKRNLPAGESEVKAPLLKSSLVKSTCPSSRVNVPNGVPHDCGPLPRRMPM